MKYLKTFENDELKFEIGDYVVIDNLIPPSNYKQKYKNDYEGIIGHIGQICEISLDWYSLNPSAPGGCWKKENLRFATPEEIENFELQRDLKNFNL